jgi:hypothetical protein
MQQDCYSELYSCSSLHEIPRRFMEPGSWLPITQKARLEDIFVIYSFDDSLDASM